MFESLKKGYSSGLKQAEREEEKARIQALYNRQRKMNTAKPNKLASEIGRIVYKANHVAGAISNTGKTVSTYVAKADKAIPKSPKKKAAPKSSRAPAPSPHVVINLGGAPTSPRKKAKAPKGPKMKPWSPSDPMNAPRI